MRHGRGVRPDGSGEPAGDEDGGGKGIANPMAGSVPGSPSTLRTRTPPVRSDTAHAGSAGKGTVTGRPSRPTVVRSGTNAPRRPPAPIPPPDRRRAMASRGCSAIEAVHAPRVRGRPVGTSVGYGDGLPSPRLPLTLTRHRPDIHLRRRVSVANRRVRPAESAFPSGQPPRRGRLGGPRRPRLLEAPDRTPPSPRESADEYDSGGFVRLNSLPESAP